MNRPDAAENTNAQGNPESCSPCGSQPQQSQWHPLAVGKWEKGHVLSSALSPVPVPTVGGAIWLQKPR